jgi:stearoyl-CoA desaturase (delta-9 desaturase)
VIMGKKLSRRYSATAGDPPRGGVDIRHSRLRRIPNILHSVLLYGGSGVLVVVGIWVVPPTAFDLALLFFGWFLTGIGITVGYHRLLAHRAFEPTNVAKLALLTLGGMAGQGPPAYWAVLHRNHHKQSDRPGDPHSPISGFEDHRIRGFFHAHFGWIHDVGIPSGMQSSTDILRDPIVKAVGRSYPWLIVLSLAIPAVIGWIHYGSVDGVLRGLIWGGAARLVVVNNIVWSINSVCHVFGPQRYRTSDSSRNTWWLSIPSLGESWHNNHHAAAGSAAFGHRWWELDVGYWVVLLMRYFRLVSNVRIVPPSALERRTCGTST